MRTTALSAFVGLVTALAAPSTGQTYTFRIDFVNQSPAGSPVARRSHAMAYDAANSQTVLFGGFGNTGYLGDTWTWNGATWQPRFVASPPPRHRHAMAYDSTRQRTVLFGGSDVGDLGDTWEWDGSTWSQVATTGPTARSHHAMAYDAARGVTVLHGGNPGGGSSGNDETWTWDGLAWTQVAAGPLVANVAMAFDTQHQLVVLCQGSLTWTWDGTAWTFLATTGDVPTPYGDSLVYHETRQRLVTSDLVSGSSSANSTHELDLATGVWELLDDPGPVPARNSHSMVYHASLDKVVLFGGVLLFGGSPGGNHNDTWVTQLLPSEGIAIGTGCGSSPLDLQAVAGPVLGQAATAELTNAPTPIAVAAVGFSNSTFGGFLLPVPMDGYGMTGCNLLISPDSFGYTLTPGVSGNPEFVFPIPNAPTLTGLLVYAQVVCVAPGENPAQLILSNAVRWTIGDV